MKKIILTILTILLTSCSSSVTIYYQLYKAKTENGKISKDNIVFEDPNCLVYYNLWSDGGDIGFSIFNKTEDDINIDLKKTFFVLNEVAYEYFQNRTFSESSNSGITTSYNYSYNRNYNKIKLSETNSNSFSTSYIEKSELTIPPKTSINISEYNVTNTYYTSCDFYKYPSRNNIKTLKYDQKNSPFKFYNLITYKLKNDIFRLKNIFYVSEITNYNSFEMLEKISKSECGEEYYYPILKLKNLSPDNFYIKYYK